MLEKNELIGITKPPDILTAKVKSQSFLNKKSMFFEDKWQYIFFPPAEHLPGAEAYHIHRRHNGSHWGSQLSLCYDL